MASSIKRSQKLSPVNLTLSNLPGDITLVNLTFMILQADIRKAGFKKLLSDATKAETKLLPYVVEGYAGGWMITRDKRTGKFKFILLADHPLPEGILNSTAGLLMTYVSQNP